MAAVKYVESHLGASHPQRIHGRLASIDLRHALMHSGGRMGDAFLGFLITDAEPVA